MVATAAGGVPYIAEDERNALLARPDHHEQLAEACFRLLEEPGLAQRLTAKGTKIVCERYSVASVRDQWGRFYKSLLNAP